MSTHTNLLRRIEGALRLPAKIATDLVEFTDRLAGDVSSDFYMPLIQKFVHTRHTQLNGAVFAFSAVSSGEGVSYVTGKIATELWRHSGQAVLVATAASLCGLEPIHLESAGPDAPRNGKVWQLARTFPESELDSASLHAETVQLLRRRFDYVLIDC